MEFEIGKTYTRPEVYELYTGIEVLRTTGSWNKGWVLQGDEALVFANVGVAGQGGYDYPNEWHGDRLVWQTTKGAAQIHQDVAPLFSAETLVHVFTRIHSKGRWTYAGLGRAEQVNGDKPVFVVWAFDDPPAIPEAAGPRRRRGPADADDYREAEPGPDLRQGPSRVLMLRDPGQLERALTVHAEIQNALAQRLRDAGHRPLSPKGGPQFDLAWESDGQMHLIEVKSLHELNEVVQLRYGLGQLAGYRAELEAAGRRVGRCILAVERAPVTGAWARAATACGVELVCGPEFSALRL